MLRCQSVLCSRDKSLTCRVSSVVEQRFCNSALAIPPRFIECRLVNVFGPKMPSSARHHASPSHRVPPNSFAKRPSAPVDSAWLALAGVASGRSGAGRAGRLRRAWELSSALRIVVLRKDDPLPRTRKLPVHHGPASAGPFFLRSRFVCLPPICRNATVTKSYNRTVAEIAHAT